MIVRGGIAGSSLYRQGEVRERESVMAVSGGRRVISREETMEGWSERTGLGRWRECVG